MNWITLTPLLVTVGTLLLLVFMQSRLILAMLRKQQAIDSADALIPRYRPRKDGIAPVGSTPEALDLTNSASLPVGLDGTV